VIVNRANTVSERLFLGLNIKAVSLLNGILAFMNASRTSVDSINSLSKYNGPNCKELSAALAKEHHMNLPVLDNLRQHKSQLQVSQKKYLKST